ncbi:MAG: hypothetical protein HYW63_04440 [Candidatus Levybacteria bacterium]|nr:hypothetical protein [Candidatus Levybacteria bacterium]
MEGQEDKLIGLKENVIIGRLIPVEGISTEVSTEDNINMAGESLAVEESAPQSV